MSNTDPAVEYLGKEVNVVVDRQLGSKHPELNYTYGVNYGYVPNSVALNGDEVEVYVLGVDKPIDGFKGQCVAVIHRLDESGDKLVVCPSHMTFSDEEIQALTKFQEEQFTSKIVRASSI